MSFTARDKVFVAAAKKLGALNDEQLQQCAEVAFARRKLGEEKEIGDVALEKGLLDASRLQRVNALVQKHEAKKRGSSSASSSSEEVQPIRIETPLPGGAPPKSPARAQPAIRIDPTPAGSGPKNPDDLIEGYSLGERIGEGGMAAVFRARHRTLDKPVALKILFTEHSANADYVARFIREARAAARIEHPNVVRIQDAGESKGRHYIAMELVEGLNLEKGVARDGPLSELAALEVAAGVAGALGAAQKEGIIHRDVKPANIVRTPDGRVKLLDLGLARAAHRTDQDGYITDHGKTLGTPFFVSPEQARGQELDIRTDIYSLGVTLFTLVTGEPPFTGQNAVDVMRKHIQEPAPSPRKRRPGLSAGFEALVMRMLEKDRKKRPESPQAVLDLIEELRAGEKDDGKRRGGGAKASAEKEKEKVVIKAPVLAARPPETHAAPTRTAATRLIMAAGALTVLLIVLLGIRASFGPPVSAAEVAKAEQERARRAAAAAFVPTGPAVSDADEELGDDWPIIEKHAREMMEGEPQAAFAYVKKMVPQEKRRGALKAAAEALEGAIQRAVTDRFERDLANAAEKRKTGHWAIAARIYQRIITTYGGVAEKARAEQELAKLEAEEKAGAAAAAAAGASGAGEGEREAVKGVLVEVAPLVRTGSEDKAEEKLRALAKKLAGDAPPVSGSTAELVEQGGKLVAELMLLDGMVAKTVQALAGEPQSFILATGEKITGVVGAIDAQGKVQVEKEGLAPSVFSVQRLAPSEKERLAYLGKGKVPDVERLLVILDLYSGERNLALVRAEKLGSPDLLDHVRKVIEVAGRAGQDPSVVAQGKRRQPAGEGDPVEGDGEGDGSSSAGSGEGSGSAGSSVGASTPPAPPPAPKPPAPPPKPKEPEGPKIATPLDRVLEALLKVPFTSEKGRGFAVKYEFVPGAEAGLEDWKFENQPIRRVTPKGLLLEAREKRAARMLHEVPMGGTFQVELVFQVEQKTPNTRVSIVFADGRGGTSYAVECGETVVKRQRGDTIQELRKSPSPSPTAVSDLLKLNADMTVSLSIADDEVKVERDGKKICEHVRVKDPTGLVGIEVVDGKVEIRSFTIHGEPDSLWVADEFKKLPKD